MQHRKRSERSSLRAVLRDQRGLTTVEYTIILCLVVVVGYAAWKQYGETVEQRGRQATNRVIRMPSGPR